ncbi:MAG: HAD family hydrolase [Bosea sp. (in: a-proteobacteria)]
MPAPNSASLPPIVVFDLDGTLAETAPDIMRVLNVILVKEGLPALPVAKARDLVGAGARALLERGFRVHGRELSPERLETLFLDFLEIYAESPVADSHLFEGVAGAMKQLSAEGYLLAVCTNKPIRHTQLILDAFGVADQFAFVAGRDTFDFCKPDPRHLTETIRLAGGNPARAVMIGDSRTDISTAQAADIPVIAVPFGYTDVPVESLNPDIVVQHFDELVAAVRRLVPALAA